MLQELDAVKYYLDLHLAKGFIKTSSVSYSSPDLFIWKTDGKIRFYVNYQRLNAISKKDHYSIALIEETLAQLEGAKYFTKINTRQAFYLIRISEDSEELTTFFIRFGAFKYLVMPFGLYNEPTFWQYFINNTLFDFLHFFI